MTATDPTLDFLDQLGDQSKWLVKRRVPIFRPHSGSFHARDGRKVNYEVTPGDLVHIARFMREMQSQGTPARMTVGHVNPTPDYPEDDNPDVIGYWLNAETGVFGPQKVPCIFVDAYVHRSQADRVQGRPYRSAEYYPVTKQLTGVAVITRDPELGLGTVELVQLSATDRGPRVRFTMAGAINMAEDKPEAVKPDLEKDPEQVKPPTEGPAGHEDWRGHMEHYLKTNPHPAIGYAMRCYDSAMASTLPGGGAGMPGGSNTYVPGHTNMQKQDTAPAKPDPETVKLQRDDAQAQYSRLEARLTALEGENATLRKERDKADRLSRIHNLQRIGYQLDTAKELVRLEKIDPDVWEEMIRQHSVPVGAPIIQLARTAAAGDGPAEMTPEENRAFAELAAANKVDAMNDADWTSARNRFLKDRRGA